MIRCRLTLAILVALVDVALTSWSDILSAQDDAQNRGAAQNQTASQNDALQCPQCANETVAILSAKLNLPLFTDWKPESRRFPLDVSDMTYIDQNGKQGQLRSLIDRPTLVTFFYTRCQNNAKCTAVVSQLASLQADLKRAGIHERVRLIGITYEPQFDTAARLKRYGTNRNVTFSATTNFLRLDPTMQQRVVDLFEAPVSYSVGWVNSHGVQLTLVDRRQRIVRKYHTTLWDNDLVVNDVTRLLGRRRPRTIPADVPSVVHDSPP